MLFKCSLYFFLAVYLNVISQCIKDIVKILCSGLEHLGRILVMSYKSINVLLICAESSAF